MITKTRSELEREGFKHARIGRNEYYLTEHKDITGNYKSIVYVFKHSEGNLFESHRTFYEHKIRKGKL